MHACTASLLCNIFKRSNKNLPAVKCPGLTRGFQADEFRKSMTVQQEQLPQEKLDGGASGRRMSPAGLELLRGAAATTKYQHQKLHIAHISSSSVRNHIHTCVYIYTHIHIYIYIYKYTYIYISIYICTASAPRIPKQGIHNMHGTPVTIAAMATKTSFGAGPNATSPKRGGVQMPAPSCLLNLDGHSTKHALQMHVCTRVCIRIHAYA